MRLIRFDAGQGPRSGELEGQKAWELDGGFFNTARRTGRAHALDGVRLLPPVIPSKFVLVSRNYGDVVTRLGAHAVATPLIFLKAPSAVVGPGVNIRYPPVSRCVTFEPELAVVMGRECRDVAPRDAAAHILGYSCTNDLCAKDIYDEEHHYTRCKSFDTFGPLGPWIVTDLDPSNLAVTGYVNGERRCENHTSKLIVGVPSLVSFTSACMTLCPGDVIATGAAGFDEVRVGDLVTVEIEGIGQLTNRVVA